MASDKKMLRRLQRLAFLEITRAMLTIRTSAVEALTCLRTTGVASSE